MCRLKLVNIPISVLFRGCGRSVYRYFARIHFKKVHIRDTSKVIIILCISFIVVTFEDKFAEVIPFASLISIMTMGIAMQKKREAAAKRLSVKFNKLWIAAEIVLFVLVGAT